MKPYKQVMEALRDAKLTVHLHPEAPLVSIVLPGRRATFAQGQMTREFMLETIKGLRATATEPYDDAISKLEVLPEC